MRFKRISLSAVCLISVISLLSGCWNYKETEKMAIVAGFAIDKKDDNYLINTEIIVIKRGKESNIETKLITSEGATIFDAVRQNIKTVGKKLYWTHAEIVVVSKEIAEEGIVPVVDWIARDAEPRLTLHILVSKEKTAKEILEQQAISAGIISFELNEMLQSQKSLSFSADIEEWEFLQRLASDGLSATLPTVQLLSKNGKTINEISGAAVFKKDKLVGFLDGEETKTLLFIRNKLKGGVLVNKDSEDNVVTSLEILKSKTKIKPSYDESKITMEIKTTTDTALDEIGGSKNYLEESSIEQLEETYEAALEGSIINLVRKTQEEFNSDIFGFGKSVKMNMPSLWKQIGPEWNDMYKNVEVQVHSTINIKNSAIMQKPIKVGD